MIEVEIKSLSTADKSLALINSGKFNFESVEQQLNYYYKGSFSNDLLESLKLLVVPYVDGKVVNADWLELIETLKTNPDAKYSVRTRATRSSELDEYRVFLVVKVSLNDTTSSNGTVRKEFNIKMHPTTINYLDSILIHRGDFEVLSRWQRKRINLFGYMVDLLPNPCYEGVVNVAIDYNVGYGHLVEFEIETSKPLNTEELESDLKSLMASLGFKELPQEHLAKMFEAYNDNWEWYFNNKYTFASHLAHDQLLREDLI